VARTTADILAQLERFLPPRYASIRPTLAGIAAVFARVELSGEDLALATTIGGAEGAWLRLIARGYGVYAQDGESDASIRERIRNVEGQVTRPAILAAVNALLAPFTDTPARMIERVDDGFWNVNFWWDTTIFCGPSRFFVLVLPRIGNIGTGSSYWDSAYFDNDFFWGGGDAGVHPVYHAIAALVNRIRAAGVSWRLTIE
jgi:hypothetical protein